MRPETVLVDILLGRDPGGGLVVYSWVHSRSDTFCIASSASDLPGTVGWDGDGDQLLRHPLADLVQETRAAVIGYPGPGRKVSRQGVELLRRIVDIIFAGPEGLASIVDLAQTGRTYLVIVPHGPFHYLPFHLLPVGEQILGDFFTVTMLPNLAMLGRQPHARRESSAATCIRTVLPGLSPFRSTGD